MSKLKSKFHSLFALAKHHKFIIERTIENTQGTHSVYEYGPLGTELRRNIRQLWWKDVVIYKERVHGTELSMFEPNYGIISNEHEGDIEEKPTKYFFNLDHLINDVVSYSLGNKCNDRNKTRDDLKEIILRNSIHVKTKNNIYRAGLNMLYETLLTDSQISLPRGHAWIGNYPIVESEINFLRNLEEEVLCLQFYFEGKAAKHWLNYWRRQRLIWWKKFANVPSNFSPHEIQQKSQVDCVIENQYSFPWGKEAIEAINYWPNCKPFDDHLKLASEVNGRLHPHILQASTNLDKAFMALLADAYEEKERASNNGQVSTRSVLHLHPSLAPIKVAIVSQNKEKCELSEVSHQLASELRLEGICTSSEWDDSRSQDVYAYYDEIGTPYCITILDSTLINGVVAFRSRETTLQEFIHISDVLKTLQSHLKSL